MALPKVPTGYSNWNDFIEKNAPAQAAKEGITLKQAKASLKLLYVSSPSRQGIGTISFRQYNEYVDWKSRAMLPEIGRPWKEPSYLVDENGAIFLTMENGTDGIVVDK